MYYVCKRLEIAGAHALKLSYESKCEDLHGHNWIVKIYCKSETLNADGMVTDFTHIKRDISGALDHKNLNDVLPFNPTAENIARWICDHVENAYRVPPRPGGAGDHRQGEVLPPDRASDAGAWRLGISLPGNTT